MTSPFNRTATAQPPAGSPFSPQAAAPAQAAPVAQAAPASSGSRFATSRERPDNYPKAADLMPSAAKGTDGALVIIRAEREQRGLKSQTGGTYDAFDTKTWILDAPRGLPQHMLEAGSQVGDGYYLPEMRWSGAGLLRDLERPFAERQLFVGRVSAYRNTYDKSKLSPEFASATDAELAQAEAYLAAHPEVDFPKTSFARAS